MKMPDQYLPTTLEGCLDYLEGIKYKSLGFGVLSLDYVYGLNYWQVSFRNPANFENPDTKSATPIEACHKMIFFLNELRKLKESNL